MSTIAGALGSHLRDEGFDTRGLVVRASVPVNLRAAEEPLTLGNKFGLVFVDMALGIRNPLQRLYAMHETMAGLKGSLQPPMTLMVLGLMGLLPHVVQAPAIELFSRKASAVVSNVPGPQAPLYMCGQRISEMYFWVPQSGTIGLGISVLSYAGRVHFGMISDRRLIKEPHKVVDRFAPEFEKLLLAATVGVLAARGKERRKSRLRPGCERQAARERAKPARAGIPGLRKWIDTVQHGLASTGNSAEICRSTGREGSWPRAEEEQARVRSAEGAQGRRGTGDRCSKACAGLARRHGRHRQAQKEGPGAFQDAVSEGSQLLNRSRSTGREDPATRSRSTRSRSVAPRQRRDQATRPGDNLEALFQSRVQKALQQIGVPNADEIRLLTKRVAELNDSVKALAAGSGRGRAKQRLARGR
jgi:hypothetical protein